MAVSSKSWSRKKPYSTPQIVDFGTIEAVTGDCFGLCLDGMNGGLYGRPMPGA